MKTTIYKILKRAHKCYIISASIVFGAIAQMFLGLHGCTINPKYGVTLTEYKVYGTVADSQDNQAIQNIKMELKDTFNSSLITGVKYTDANGKYMFQFSHFPEVLPCRIEVSDVDDTINGSYVSKDTSIIIPNVTGHEKNSANEIKVDIFLRRIKD